MSRCARVKVGQTMADIKFEIKNHRNSFRIYKGLEEGIKPSFMER
jgi:hypothetical protein